MSGTDEQFMALALAQARRAFAADEVPVGAVVVFENRVVGEGFNQKERLVDPTAHAEVLALRQAAARLGRWRLGGCTVYASLEPCPMCLGAMLSARVDRLVFGCADPKAGAAVSLYQLAQDPRFNHRIEVAGGVLSEECASLLKEFFEKKRVRHE
jgi:tRNA(adenine34) deaminase